jgi:hypothetical protein
VKRIRIDVLCLKRRGQQEEHNDQVNGMHTTYTNP